ncbi:MAG: trypsin-like peptidase domain-containing protein [Alphaproteobacteria bacterium]|nr:trypsin-like peptidase domain-containing protein [Alphaproteobacteria bacterium]
MQKNFKIIGFAVVASVVTSVLTLFVFSKFSFRNGDYGVQKSGKIPVNYAGYFGDDNGKPLTDFTVPAQTATPAVVHIQTKTKAREIKSNQRRRANPFGDPFGDDFFDDFFGGPQRIPEQQASGSGVIIKDDGFIITNNHVVKDADEISVTLANNKSYKATVIGTDANTDLAVIKIEETNLPYLVYGNSDNVKLGQWVLAIGYPLNLDVTVTAGIISAKNRNIGVNRSEGGAAAPIESFLQTDAAVNKGNSGGALVNTNGELVGINSAIASPTGTYAGYSYAIPVNLVKKVVNDIVKYGMVQRAYLGVSGITAGTKIPTEDKEKIEKEAGIKWDELPEGVVIVDVIEGGAAKKAGLQKGDLITKINDIAIKTMPEMQEQIARFKPGDKVVVTYQRKNKTYTVNCILKNKLNNEAIERTVNIIDKLGGTLEPIDNNTAAKYNVNGGILIKKKGEGLLSKSKLEEGFVIVSVNDLDVTSLDELKQAFQKFQNEKVVYIIGFYLGNDGMYRVPLELNSDKK